MYHVFPYKSTKLFRNLIISSIGEYIFCGDSELIALRRSEPLPGPFYNELKTKHFICAEGEIGAEKMIMGVRRQTKQSYLESSSILLMVVPTIECNCDCIYCQASSKKAHQRSNFMRLDTAYEFCEFALALPHTDIKIEFQGGEPTLHMPAIQFIVKYLEKHKHEREKSIAYVICTNLLEIDLAFIRFAAKHQIDISTSLDGDRELHDHNRPSHKYLSTYSMFQENIAKLRSNGIYPSALLTITRYTMKEIRRIIDEYIGHGFSSVFIRQLNSYGYAYNNSEIQYSNDEFMDCYETGLRYILLQNLEYGNALREELFSILLKKIMTPFLDGFVDLQNPTALARMCLLINHDGSVYPSDEARMMAEMGNRNFQLGNLSEHCSYESMITRSPVFSRLHYLDEIQECRACAYQPYCGADPVRSYYADEISGDSFCGKRKGMYNFLFTIIEEASKPQLRLFRSWANE
jgi:uncharacterized protein